MDSGDIDKWRAYFSGLNSTIFDVIENAIFVAALDHPQEFKVRREQLVLKLFTCDLIKCSPCEGDFSKSGRSFASAAASASAHKSRVKWSKSLSDPNFVNFQHYREDNGLHSHVASRDGLSTTVASNCVRQRQSVVGQASPGGSEYVKDYEDNCCSIIEGVDTLAVKAREENSFVKEENVGSKKAQECNIVVNRKKSTDVDQVDNDSFSEALMLVNKITHKNTMPSNIVFGSQEASSRKTRMSNEFEVHEMTNLGCRHHGNQTFMNQDDEEKSEEVRHISISSAKVVHDGRQAQTAINHVNEEDKMVKVDCLNGCTFSEVQALVNDTAEENHLIKDNEIGSYYILEIEEDDEILKEATIINKALRKSHTQNDLVITAALQKLHEMDLNIQILRATMIGETVTALRKHGSKQIRKFARALIRKWKMLVDGWVEAQAANSGDKISDNFLGDDIFVSDGLPYTKEPPLHLHQENLPDSFSNGGVPATPSCTPLDLLKLYDDVDYKQFFSILPYDDASPVMENVNKEQDSTEKPSLIVKDLELKLSKNTETGRRATPDRNGVQSPLGKKPLHTHGGLQASQEHAVERALQAKECNDIRCKLNSSSFDTRNMSQLHQTGDLGERITSECGWKGNSAFDVQQQLKQNIPNKPQKTVERFWQAKECNDLRSKLKSRLLDTHKRQQLNGTGHLGKRVISECDRKGKGVVDVQRQLKQNTVNSLQVSIARAWQAKECKDIQPELKSSSCGTHKRALLNETNDIGQRTTSPCDWKVKGATDVHLQHKQNTVSKSQVPVERAVQAKECTETWSKLKPSSVGTHKREQLSQTGDLGKRITSDCDWKAKGSTYVQHQPKQNIFYTSNVILALPAQGGNAIESKLKPSSLATPKRVQPSQTGNIVKRIISERDRKGKGSTCVLNESKQDILYSSDAIPALPAQGCNGIQSKLKPNSSSAHKRAQLSQTEWDLKAKGINDGQHQLKKNTLNSSQARHRDKVKSSEEIERLRLEETGKKLRAGYQDHKNAKKRRAVQVIDPKFVKDMNRKHRKKQLI